MFRKLLLTVVAFLFTFGSAFAQSGSLTGTVTDASSGEVLPGSNVLIAELSRGASVNPEGTYEISDLSPGTYKVTASFIGYTKLTKTATISEGEETVLDFELQSGINLDEVVVTGIGGEIDKRTVTFSSQDVSSEDLNVAQSSNIKTSLAGKVSGLQIVGQAGSKLGEAGDIRIRGAVSLNEAVTEPLYVLDGVPGIDPNTIDMNNIQDVNILKGPNATALYGQRGENGVVVLSSKGGRGAEGVSVEINNSITFDKVAYLPNYQNQYGQGYNRENEFQTYEYDPSVDPAYFEPLDGKTILTNYWADESWGPKLGGGQTYAAWHNFFPDSPTYGESTEWKARPDNVKNFFETGVTNKSNFAVNYAEDRYSTRISYTNLSQSGILPYSDLNKHYISGNFDIDVTEAFNVSASINYSLQDVNGDITSDGYSNQTTGTFNQWFGRQLSVENMRRFRNLQTPEGYQTNWNWYGPTGSPTFPRYGTGYSQDGIKKPAFWFNSYTWMEQYSINRKSDDLVLNVDASYDLGNGWEATASANRSTYDYHRRYEVPYTFQNSSDQGGLLYNHYVNSFGERKIQSNENNFDAQIEYDNNFGDWSVEVLGGTNFRDEHWERLQADMAQDNYQSGGLIIPNQYQYGNSREQVVPEEEDWDKQVFSLYGRANFGYKDMLFLNGTYRHDWSSALPNENNGYGYPSVGASFVFTELVESDILTFGKLRLGWAQVGNDVGAERIFGSFQLESDPYTNPLNDQTIPLLYSDDTRIDPNIKPAINSSYEAGVDLEFFNNRLGFSATYFTDKREDAIIGISVSSGTGAEEYLTNGGLVEKNGFEFTLEGSPVITQNFQWRSTFNFSTISSVVEELPAGLNTYTVPDTRIDFGFTNMVHVKGKEWGQLYGGGTARNENGQPIFQTDTDGNPTGIHVVEQNKALGSVLPNFTGGWNNTFTYKGLSLQATIDFQQGGQFFTLTEQWGQSGGLLEETAENNDLGNPVRDPIYDGDGNLLPESERGGKHITGVTADGQEVDRYVDPQTYYGQFIDSGLAEPFIIDASYVKLRALNLSYSLPKRWLGGYLNSARVGVIARNLWMIAVSGENDHGWDPSELSQTYGENGQLPGVRSYGFNVNITF